MEEVSALAHWMRSAVANHVRFPPSVALPPRSPDWTHYAMCGSVKTIINSTWGVMRRRRVVKRIQFGIGGVLLPLAGALYGVLPPVLDRLDRAPRPNESLPQSAALSGSAVLVTRFLERPGGSPMMTLAALGRW